MKHSFVAAAIALAASAAGAQTVIYDTFNEDDQANLFDCCNWVNVSARHSWQGLQEVAVPFTPAQFAKIKEVDVALSSTFTTNYLLKVEVVGSTMGLPGRVKHSWFGVFAPMQGQCCTFQALTVGQAIHAMPGGGQYWVVVKGETRAIGGWDLNTLGLSGPYAVMSSDGTWAMTEGPLPAVRIIGR